MVAQHYRWDFIGLSTDDKPTPGTSNKVTDGSTFYCSDTSKLYVFYKGTWYERTAAGGGGGTSYTAGDGIDITDDTISVDTETIQPKLTAGTNITISEDNVISAEGGSSVNVVQSMGTSTTDVMSQNATTTMIHPAGDTNHRRVAIGQYSYAPSDNDITIGYRAQAGTGGKNIALGSEAKVTSTAGYSVSIGSEASCSSTNAVAIGTHSKSDYTSSVALGNWAQTTKSGQVNIGTGTQAVGYSSSTYRLLSGVYDGQEAHDAVTVNQVNSLIDSLNSALNINIPHIGATS